MRVLVAGLGILLVTLSCSSPSSAPAGGPPVITAGDALRPRAGEDYSRITTLHLRDGEAATYVTAAGDIVLGRADGRAYVLLDPTTGRRRALPTPGRYASVVELSATAVWYADTGPTSGDTTIYRYNRATHHMRGFMLPDISGRKMYTNNLLGRFGGRLYYTSGPRQDHLYDDVWSVRFGEPRTLRREARHKVAPTLGGGALVWGTFDLDGPNYLVMHDLATGTVTRAEVPDGCRPDEMPAQGDGQEFVLTPTCDDPEREGIVVDRSSGEVTAVLRVAMEDGALGTSDRGVFFHALFYDFSTGRLLDLSDVGNGGTSPVSGPGEHPVQVWPQQHRDLVVRLK